MAVIESKFFSKELFRSVCVNIVLPLPDSGDYFFETSTNYPKEGEKYPVLYLLHRPYGRPFGLGKVFRH